MADGTAARDATAAQRPASEVVGRAHELAVIDEFLSAAATGPTALLIDGPVGAGKSTIWRAALAAAESRGFRVLVSRPVEAEARLTYAALGDLLDGFADTFPLLPDPQRSALAVATLAATPGGEPPDQRAIGLGLLGVLRAVSASSPILVAIDDMQWLDPPSTRVIEFALRRLRDEPVGLLGVLRAGERAPIEPESAVQASGGRVFRVPVGAMSVDELDELLRRRLDLNLTRPALVEVRSAAGGNPMFALEIAKAISTGELQPRSGHRLPVPTTLQELVRERVAALPPAMRQMLAFAAAATHPTVDLLDRAGVLAPNVADPLGAAIRKGFVFVVGDRVEFTHPLFASTLYYALSPAQRRDVHRRLADLVTSPLERARHLATAVDRPDATVAAALDEAARLASRRGAPDTAAELLEDAARLTPGADRDSGRRRRKQAAELHFAAGDTPKARSVLEALAAEADPGLERADILRRLANVRYNTDSTAIAAELLSRALAEAGGDRTAAAGIKRDLAWAEAVCGDVRRAAEHAAAALAALEPGDSALLPELLAASAMATFALGDADAFDAIRRAVVLDRHDRGVPIEWRPATVLAVMLKTAGELEAAETKLRDLRRRAVDEGEETALPFLLAQLSEVHLLRGGSRDALRLADEAVTAARQTSQDTIRAGALHARALAEAHVGDVDAARASAAEGLQLAERVGSVLTMMLNQGVIGFVDIAIGDPKAAYETLAPLAAWQDVVGVQEPGMLRFVPDLVECLIALGHLERADALLEPYAEHATRLQREAAQLAAARCRAYLMSASGASAPAAAVLERALATPGMTRQPFEHARALLALGVIERRTRRKRSARTHLETARRLFTELGAHLWASKTERLLGGASTERNGWARALTPAEQRVAELVAAGSTNRQVADRLFVTVRTVELHLTNIYRKLGLSSRTQLARALARGERGPSERMREGAPLQEGAAPRR